MKKWFRDEYGRIMIVKEIFPFYRIHELADRYPLMNSEEREALKQSLLKSGQINPIMLFDDKIIDGRNRYLVMKDLFETGQLNFKPEFKQYQCDEEDLPKIVEALNVHRRHLSPSQKAAIGVKTHLNAQKQLAQERQQKGVSIKVGEGGKTAEAIAKLVGVSTTYVEKAMKVMRDKELFALLEEGKINVVDAEIVVSNATPEQCQEIIERIKYNIPGLRYRISSITPRKKQKPKDVDCQLPAIIVLRNLEGDDETTKLIKQKIKELSVLMDRVADEDSKQIWYEPCSETLKKELKRFCSKIKGKKLPE